MKKSKSLSMFRRWPISILVIIVAIIIALIIVAALQESWTLAISILSIVLGWLLKSLSDTITLNQRRKWELDDVARERSLAYYENKLNDISRYITGELERITSLTHTYIDGQWRIDSSKFVISCEWYDLASAVRTFVQVIAQPDVIDVYLDTYNQLHQFNKFIEEVNLGKFDHLKETERKEKVQDEVGTYMDKLKDFQVVVERNRLKALRNELELSPEFKNEH